MHSPGCRPLQRRPPSNARQSTLPTKLAIKYSKASCSIAGRIVAHCTEKFTDTPEWPIRRTPCNHAFHYTCLQHILRQRAGQPKCPMCRRSLTGMTSTNTQGAMRAPTGTGTTTGASAGAGSGTLPLGYAGGWGQGGA